MSLELRQKKIRDDALENVTSWPKKLKMRHHCILHVRRECVYLIVSSAFTLLHFELEDIVKWS